MRSLRRRAAAALLTTALFWGASFPLSKVVQMVHARMEPGASGWFYAVSTIWPRFAIALLLLAMLAGHRGIPRTRREVWQGTGLALFMAVGLVLQVDGLRHTEASTSAFLSQLFVIIVPVVVYGRLRRWPPGHFMIAAALVLAGVGVLADLNWRSFRMGRGELETLASTLFFAGQILWLERPVFRGNRPLAVTQVMFVVTLVIFVIAAFALAPRAEAVVLPWASLPWVTFTACLAVFCTVVTFALMNTWQPRLEASEAGIIYCAEPVFAAAMAMFLPGLFSVFAGLDYANETVTMRLLIGGGLITAANVLVQLRPATPGADTRGPDG